jgi:hypothetical protein
VEVVEQEQEIMLQVEQVRVVLGLVLILQLQVVHLFQLP